MDNRLSGLVLSPELKEKILSQATPPPRKKSYRVHKTVAAALAACLVLAFGIRAITAGGVPSYDTLAKENGVAFAENSQRIMMDATEYSDIEMDAIAVLSGSNSAVVYLTLRDLAGNRINESTELLGVTVNNDVFNWTHLTHFDNENNTATYRLETFGENLAVGQDITVSFSKLLNGGEYVEGIDTGYTLADLQKNSSSARFSPAGQEMNYSLNHGGDAIAAQSLLQQLEEGSFPLLVPGTAPFAYEAPGWLETTDAALRDDWLHLRFRPIGEAGLVSSPEFYLAPQEGEALSEQALLDVGLGEAVDIGGQQFYTEHEQVLPLPHDQTPESLSLMLKGYRYSEVLSGDWSLSFPLTQPVAEKSMDTEINLGGYTINRVVVSPINLCLYATGEMSETDSALEVEVYLMDGSVVEIVSASVSSDGSSFVFSDSFATPVSLSEISHVKINSQEYYFS